MNESEPSTLYVAMRSKDRKILFSPRDEPDFFTFSVNSEATPLESRVTRLMRENEGVVVNSDHALQTPDDEPSALAYATYQRHVLDYERTQQHGKFNVHDVRDARHTLLDTLHRPDDFSTEQLREARLKAILFQQVIRLFETHR